MNKNITIVLFIVLLILVGGYLWAQSNGAPGEPSVNDTDKEFTGEVVAIDREQVAADGPTLLTVEEEGGGTTIVAVPSMGINLCEARDNIADVFALEVGTSVEVRGAVGPEGEVVPCESADHYLSSPDANQSETETNEVSWEEVDGILASGEVEQVVQLHSREVRLTLEDGTEVVTTEPEIDAIFERVEACGEPCADIVIATE